MKFIEKLRRKIYRQVIREDLFHLLKAINKIENGDQQDDEIWNLVNSHFPDDSGPDLKPELRQFTVIMMPPLAVLTDRLKERPLSFKFGSVMKAIYVTHNTGIEAEKVAGRVMADVYSSTDGGVVYSPDDFEAVTVLKGTCRLDDQSAQQVVLP